MFSSVVSGIDIFMDSRKALTESLALSPLFTETVFPFIIGSYCDASYIPAGSFLRVVEECYYIPL